MSLDQLALSVRTGSLASDDLVWTAGMASWQPASSIPRLCAMPTPLPIPPTASDGGSGSDDAVLRMLVPIGRSGWAIASGYLAFFSFLPLVGPLALVTGILAVRHMHRRAGVHGMGRAVFGIVCGSLGTAFYLVALAGMLLQH